MKTAKLRLFLLGTGLMTALQLTYAQGGVLRPDLVIDAGAAEVSIPIWSLTGGAAAKPFDGRGFGMWPRVFTFAAPPPAANDIWLGGTGNWNDPTKWSAGVPGAGSAVLIDNGNPVTSAFNLNIGNGAANTLTIDSGDALNFNNNAALTISGPTIANSGSIGLGSTGNATELIIGGNVTLSGGGTLTMSNNGNNFTFGSLAADTLTNRLESLEENSLNERKLS